LVLPSLESSLFFKGAKSVVLETYELNRFLEVVQKYQVSYAHISAAHLTSLADDSSVKNFDLSSLKVILLTEYIEETLIKRVQDRLKNVKVKRGYGVRDLTPPLILSPTNKIKPGSVGVLLAETEAKILDPATNEEVGVDMEGDLYVKGGQAFTEYYSNPEATKQGLDEHKFIKTGERGKVDKDGYWWIFRKENQK